jgi:hypothetical protein
MSRDRYNWTPCDTLPHYRANANARRIYIPRHGPPVLVLPISWGLSFGSIKKPPEIQSGGDGSLHPPRDQITWQDTDLRDTETGAYRIPYRVHQKRCPNQPHFFIRLIRLHFFPPFQGVNSKGLVRPDALGSGHPRKFHSRRK